MYLKIGGIALLFVSVMGGFVLAGGSLVILWQPPEYLIIFGGALAALFISNSWNGVKEAGRAVMTVLKGKHLNQDYFQRLLTLLYQLFEVRCRSGVQVLEEHIERPYESQIFIQSGNASEYISFLIPED